MRRKLLPRGDDATQVNNALQLVGKRCLCKLLGKNLFFVFKVCSQVEGVQHVIGNINRLERSVERNNVISVALDNFDF